MEEYNPAYWEAVKSLEDALSKPMTPQVGRLVSLSDQLRSRLRDNPDWIALVAEKMDITEEDLRAWVYQN